MKKVTLFALLALFTLSSCSFEGYQGCPAYSGQNKRTKHGIKAQGTICEAQHEETSVVDLEIKGRLR